MEKMKPEEVLGKTEGVVEKKVDVDNETLNDHFNPPGATVDQKLVEEAEQREEVKIEHVKDLREEIASKIPETETTDVSEEVEEPTIESFDKYLDKLPEINEEIKMIVEQSNLKGFKNTLTRFRAKQKLEILKRGAKKVFNFKGEDRLNWYKMALEKKGVSHAMKFLEELANSNFIYVDEDGVIMTRGQGGSPLSE